MCETLNDNTIFSINLSLATKFCKILINLNQKINIPQKYLVSYVVSLNVQKRYQY